MSPDLQIWKQGSERFRNFFKVTQKALALLARKSSLFFRRTSARAEMAEDGKYLLLLCACDKWRKVLSLWDVAEVIYRKLRVSATCHR